MALSLLRKCMFTWMQQKKKCPFILKVFLHTSEAVFYSWKEVISINQNVLSPHKLHSRKKNHSTSTNWYAEHQHRQCSKKQKNATQLSGTVQLCINVLLLKFLIKTISPINSRPSSNDSLEYIKKFSKNLNFVNRLLIRISLTSHWT